MVVIIKKGEIVESRILMMKPIDSIYDLICVLSDAGCFDQDETIKAGKIMLCQRKTCQKIGRWVGGTVDVSIEGFGPWIRASGQEE